MSKATMVYKADGYRIVLVERDRYVIERRSGEDALGVEQWTHVGECLCWTDKYKEGNEISVPRSIFRGLMEIVRKATNADAGKAVEA